MNWTQQYEIIKELISKKTGENPSRVAVAQFLEVTRGKVQAWDTGQRPSADDLETIARKLEISPVWLLLGDDPAYNFMHDRGELNVAETTSGQVVGDILHDLLLLKHATLEVAAEALGVQFEELDACIGRAQPPSWSMLQKFAEYGININFLLTGEGLDRMPDTEIERAMLAVGARDTWEMGSKLGVKGSDVDRHLKEARQEGRVMPRLWHEVLLEKYGLNPAWTMSGKYPSHIERTQPTKGHAHAPQLKAASNHATPTDYKMGDACGIDADPPTPKVQRIKPSPTK